jgi:hypothetical protein
MSSRVVMTRLNNPFDWLSVVMRIFADEHDRIHSAQLNNQQPESMQHFKIPNTSLRHHFTTQS